MVPNLSFNRPSSRPYTDGAYCPEANLQWWYFDGQLTNGCRLLTFFLPRFDGIIDGRDRNTVLVNIVLRKPDGETIRERRFFPSSEMIASQDSFDTVLGKDCFLRHEKGTTDKGRYHLRAQAGRLRYDLEIIPELPPWSPAGRSGRSPHLFMRILRKKWFTSDYFHYVPFVPRGRLKGKITVDGNSHDIEGTAYHEQGRLNFSLSQFLPAWYWLHIENAPWTILSGTTAFPAGFPAPKDGTLGGIGYVQKGDQCLLAAFDITGLIVRWPRIKKRDLQAENEMTVAWEAEARLRRPGLKVKLELISKDVLELIPFDYQVKTPVKSFWGQTVADIAVEIKQGPKLIKFETEGLLETMTTGRV